jgi:hypothetical protein
MRQAMSPTWLLLLLLLPLAACTTPAAVTTPDGAPPAVSAPVPAIAAASVATAAPVDTSSPVQLSARGRKALSNSLSTAMGAVPPGAASTVVRDTFLLIAGDRGAPLAQAAALTDKTFAALYSSSGTIMRHRPEWAITVFLYSTHAAYANAIPAKAPHDSYGLYYPDSHTIYVETEGGGTGDYQHELVHSLEGSDFPLAPVAVDEAVASYFELATITGDDAGTPTPHALPHFRIMTLRRALADAKTAGLVDLQRVLSITDEGAFGDLATYSINYGCAREMARWLDGRHQLWDFYRTCREDILDDPTCAKSFTKVTGLSPQAATAPFVQWVQSDEAVQ